jgi:hypothetical protein
MSPVRLSRQRPHLRPPRPRARLQVELLEGRNLLSSGLTLTNPVRVSDPNPLPPPASSSPTVFTDSEVEPQIAVNPKDTTQAVAVWQQDRFRSVGGARALAFSVSINANADTSHWSVPAVIPGFDATNPSSPFARYTDPWVSIAPDGTVYAAALGLTPAGPVPGDTAVLVITGSITITDSGPTITWNRAGPATLIHTTAPGSLPIDQANDKEMIVADPHDLSGQTAYVVWDQIDFPSDTANFNALHAGAADRENAFFSKTTDGGANWTPAQNITNFLDLEAASGNQLVVEPDGSLVDLCTLFKGSGSQPGQADKITVAALRLPAGSNTWSDPIIGPAVEAMPVTDPDTGAPVRDGEQLLSVAVDRSGGVNNGDLYAVWADGRFSNFTHEDIALSVSKDGGKTWSDPIKVNQTPTTIPDGDRQAFTPTVAVNSVGTVAVTYYDFRNNADLTPGSGLPTDYFIAVNPNPVSNPSNWSETQLTTSSFNLENAAATSRGYFLGDYQGLAAAGQNFYALFGQAGGSKADPSNIWFRDPPPAAAGLDASPPAAPGELAVDVTAALGIGAFAGDTPGPDGTGSARAGGWSSGVDPLSPMRDNLGPLLMPASQSAEVRRSGGGTDSAGDGGALPDAICSDG